MRRNDRGKLSGAGMRTKFLLPKYLRDGQGNSTYNHNFVHRNNGLKAKVAAKKQQEAEFAAHEKRIQFRAQALRFIEWRDSRSRKTP